MLSIRIVKSNVASVGSSSERNMESHDFIAIHIGYTPTCLYFYLHLNTAYGAHYVYLTIFIRHTIDSFKIYLRKNRKDEDRKIDDFKVSSISQILEFCDRK